MADRSWRATFATLILATAASDLAAQGAPARGWTVVPSIAVRGTYTDNVSLAAAPERGELVTQVSPGISISGRGARFSGNLSYTANALFYARNNENDRLVNTLSASGNLEAVESFFFIDAQGNVTQNFISPFAARPADIATVTDNRVETRTFSLSPYVRGQLFGGYAYELRNRNTWTTADSALVSKIHTRQWSGSLASPISLFGWGVDGSSSDISYDDELTQRPDQETSIVRARLFFQPDASLRLSATRGHEENNYNSLAEKRSYSTYGYGLRWQPTPRTTAEFDWEHRFFGSSRLASFSHRTRLTAWTASYSRSASNFQQELLRLPPGNTVALLDQIFLARFPDPVQRQAAVEQFLRSTGTPLFLANPLAFFTQQILLEERVQGSMALLGVRNSITFTAFGSRSTALTDPVAAVPAELLLAAGSRIKQHGFGASASHQLTPFTGVGASANRTFSIGEDPPRPEARNDTYTLSLNHTVSPKTSTFGGATYTKFESAGSPSAYARSVFAGLEHRF